MLKACWDCVSAGFNENRNRGENDGAYSVRLNGDTQRAPPWPQPRHNSEIMFVLPRQLNSGDRIDVAGSMRSNPQMFTVNLLTGYSSPDYSNIACQLEAQFSQNRLSLKIIQNGIVEEIPGDYQSIPATDWFADTNFGFGFTVSVYGNQLEISIGESSLEQIQLKHSVGDIKFLALDGDIEKVDKLEFKFA